MWRCKSGTGVLVLIQPTDWPSNPPLAYSQMLAQELSEVGEGIEF